jgi:hypothetical protein
MSWHVDEQAVRRYQSDDADRVASASLETHLTRCEQCRGLLTVDDDWLERSWIGVADRVEPGKSGVVESGLTRLGVPSHLARVVAVSPALRVSFLLAVALVVGFAAMASTSNPAGGTYRIFLAVAPLLPVAGVAFAYGRLADPAFEFTVVSPIDSIRLLLLRAATVLTVSIVLGLVVWPIVPAPGSVGISAWLLPALTLTLVTLALASRLEVWLAAALVGGGWVAAMLLAVFWEVEAFDADAQALYAAVAFLAAGAVLIRRTHYDREEGRR